MIEKDVELMITPNDLANVVHINTVGNLMRKSLFIIANVTVCVNELRFL